MELLCPECLGTLVISDDNATARCTVHGGTFKVLFRRRPGAVPAPVAPETAMARLVVAAQQVGSMEGAVMANAPVPMSAPPPVAPLVRYAGMRCVQHPTVQATERCDSCGAYMCATCDFALPGSMHVCPACAVSSQTKLGAKRKRSLIWSFAMAGWCTVGMVLFFVSAASGMTKQNEAVLGVLFSLGILIPSIIGFAIGFGAIDRRLKNPPILWVAMVWNGIILAILVLLMVVGSFK